jgi:galactose mutarotase-like enzyme
MAQRTWTILDTDGGVSHPEFSLTANDLGIANHDFHVQQTRLRGGLKEGVDSITVDNGRFSFIVLPTRGMSIWKARLGKAGQPGTVDVGWNSPVDGPVHPQFVPQAEGTGLGWLDGFDELFVRCGLRSNGAPDFDDHGHLKYGLHGQIANRPARQVELSYDDQREEIRLTGVVDETRFMFHRIRMRTTISTRLGEAGLRVRDEVTNLGGTPTSIQMLYHINFGPPLLEAGSRLVAPIARLAPRDARAVEGIESWDRYSGPIAGFTEQVYFADLAAGPDHLTHVLLENANRTLGVSVGFDKRQLPCFMQWKNTQALADGYVTGLEPSTNFPNPHSFEEKQKRVVPLAPGASVTFDTSLTIHPDQSSVAAAEQAIAQIAGGRKAQIASTPRSGWSVNATTAW